ncbi:MAG: tRNA lysidine(34) synthetase TilS [Flavobacteriales bacterium]
MTPLEQHVHDALVGSGWTKGQPVVVGASGGLDSTVLLHVLGALGVPSVVAHVNHHTRGDASQGDAAFVAELAERFGWPFEELHLEAEELKQGAQGFQGEAHKARQAWFESLRQAHRAHAVLTAHHADDQAETWLLQAMRNTNPLSLRGMLPWDGSRLKPLLQVPKRELEAYANAQDLAWREDASNAERTYRRNQVRHDLLPVLEAAEPGVSKHLRQLATRMADLNAAVQATLQRIRTEAEVQPGLWNVDALHAAPLGRETLRHALREAGWPQRHAERVIDLLQEDTQVGRSVALGQQHVVRERTHLRWTAVPQPGGEEDARGMELRWEDVPRHPQPLGTTGLNVERGAGPADPTATPMTRCWVPAADFPLEVRPWQAGDRIQPLGMEGRSLVSDVLTQAKLPHTQRPHAQVLARQRDGVLLWVAGLKRAEQARLGAEHSDLEGAWFAWTAP